MVKQYFLGVTVLGFVWLLVPWLSQAATATAIDTFSTFAGTSTSNDIGRAVASAGDVNGDGYADMLIGDSSDTTSGTNTGKVYLMYGQVNQFSLLDADLENAIQFTGEAAGDKAGFAVATAGDVNHDGYDDILIGAPGVSSSTGAMYLIYGQATILSTQTLSAAVKFTGVASGDNLGYSVAGVGDIDGDGFEDFVAGAPYNDTSGASDSGAVYLMRGQQSSFNSASVTGREKFLGDQIVGYAGWSVAGAGDVNGNSKTDILIGAMGDVSGDGAAYLIYGQVSTYTTTSLLSNVALGIAVKFSGTMTDTAGSSVATAGDVNGDSKTDILIGAPQNSTAASKAGAVYLVYGSSTLSGSIALSSSSAVRFKGVAASDHAGTAVSSGDVNGDGKSDIIIGAPDYDLDEDNGDAGATYVIYGDNDGDLNEDSITDTTDNISLSEADAQYAGTVGQNTGSAVAGTGDVDNDNYDDLMIGAPNADEIGAVYLGYIGHDTDADNDGTATDTDCNDADATVAVTQTYYADADGDTLGDGTTTTTTCSMTAPAGYAANDDDPSDSVFNHATYYSSDPTDAAVFSDTVASFKGSKNGKIKVSYTDFPDSYYTYHIFDLQTDAKTIVKQYKNTGYVLVLHPKGKTLALVNPYTGLILDTVTLSKDQKYSSHGIKQANLRKDQDNKIEVVITSTTDQAVRLSVVAVNVAESTLTKKDSETLETTEVDATNTALASKTITLQTAKDKTVQVYNINKKYALESAS